MIKPVLLPLFILAMSWPVSLLAGGPEDNGSANPKAANQDALANPLAELSLSTLDETRKRPLFSPARHPKLAPVPRAVSVVEVPPSPPEPPSLVLLAVLSDEQGARAIVKANPAEKPRNIKIGDDIAGWRVSEIEPRRLVLVQAERQSDFALFESRTKPIKVVTVEKGRRNH